MGDFALENAQQVWRQQAHLDSIKNKERKYQQGRGPCNIFILDTSSKVVEDGFIQMKQTFCTIMDEYSKYPETDENVAVIICGRTTAFKYHYSNQYNQIKRCIDDVEHGGPSPLTSAFLLSLGAILNGAGYSKMIGEFHVYPRIILISEGRPTDFTIMRDDELPLHGPDEVKDHLHQIAKIIGNPHPIYCIPVGKNPDMVNLGFISSLSRGGKIIYPHEAKQLAKYSVNMKAASIICSITELNELDRGTISHLLTQGLSGRDFNEMDMDDIFDICSKKLLFTSMEGTQLHVSGHNSDNVTGVFPEKDSQMIPLGGRVKRGPDWKWKNQDNYCPGTVIAYSKDVGWLIVEWDTGYSNSYRYGTTNVEKNKYDVVVCEEPRILESELIAIGCLVRRGPDWELGDLDGGTGSIGAVYRVKTDGIVYIHWRNGNRHDCRYGFDGKFDLTLCDPFSSEVKSFLQEQKRQAQYKLPESLQHIYSDASTSANHMRTVDKKMILEEEEATNGAGPLLTIPKGRYFKNDTLESDSASSDVEADCDEMSDISLNCDHFLWKDQHGVWNHYPKKINDKMIKCYKKNPGSTVVISLRNQLYRVILSRNVQIDLKTREELEIKFVIGD